MAMILKRQYLTVDQVKKLNEISTERVNFSEHIRRAVDEYLEKQKKQKSVKK
jgi:metal-responsive CopG/Arc/MetJ family transcriptional regulator